MTTPPAYGGKGRERRRHARVQKQLLVTLWPERENPSPPDDPQRVIGRSLDISVGGILVDSPRAFPVGARLSMLLTIQTPDGLERVPVSGSVVRVGNPGFGIKFDTLSPRALTVLLEITVASMGGGKAD